MESPARLCRPGRQASLAHPRGKPGFSTLEMNVDLVEAHLDPFDHGSEDRTLAGDGQLGPVLADVCGQREKTLLD
jgi:hypothetical protein